MEKLTNQLGLAVRRLYAQRLTEAENLVIEAIGRAHAPLNDDDAKVSAAITVLAVEGYTYESFADDCESAVELRNLLADMRTFVDRRDALVQESSKIAAAWNASEKAIAVKRDLAEIVARSGGQLKTAQEKASEKEFDYVSAKRRADEINVEMKSISFQYEKCVDRIRQLLSRPGKAREALIRQGVSLRIL